MLDIRLLDNSDSVPNITARIHRAYARRADMGLNDTAVDQSPEVTAKRISGGTCFVATMDDTLVGTIVVQPTYAPNECDYFARPGVAAAHQFAVDPARQGLGIGRSLLSKSEEWTTDQGFRELAMDTAKLATHLIDLHKGLGCRHVARGVLSKILREEAA